MKVDDISHKQIHSRLALKFMRTVCTTQPLSKPLLEREQIGKRRNMDVSLEKKKVKKSLGGAF